MEGLANRCTHQSNVVAEFAVAEFCHFFHDAALGFRGRTAGRPRYLDDSLGAKLDSLLVFRFRDPVGEEQQAVEFGSERSEEHTSELQSHLNLVCRLLLEKKKKNPYPVASAPPV